MDKSERIYIAPKRGRLPRRYEVIDQWPVEIDRPMATLAQSEPDLIGPEDLGKLGGPGGRRGIGLVRVRGDCRRGA